MVRNGHDLEVKRHHVIAQSRHDHFLQVEPHFGYVPRPLVENTGDGFEHL